ncbi:MAG: hypothetical protein ABJN62_19810 [Halioglobus sp.]
MTEAELVMVASEAFDRVWSLLQWWASVSFGLLVVAHIASHRIGTYLAILVPVLYTCFSLGIVAIMRRNLGIVQSVYEDLGILQATDIELSVTAKYMMQGAGIVGDLALPIALLATYVGVIGYFIYSYRTERYNDNV